MLRHNNFQYAVSVRIRFTAGDLRVLHFFSEQHYDGYCKRFFVPGPDGTGNGWRHFSFAAEIDPFDEKVPDETECEPNGCVASWRDLDLCLKILEGRDMYLPPAVPGAIKRDPKAEKMAVAAERLDSEIRAVMQAIRDEYKRIGYEEGKSSQDPLEAKAE